jgi:rare lipoprotein A
VSLSDSIGDVTKARKWIASRRAEAGFWRLAIVSVVSMATAAGCSHHTYTTRAPARPPSQPSVSPAPAPTVTQPVAPGEYVEQGVASWYGAPFNGHRTSDGEIYDMHAFTAAHRTLPFGSVVRITNLRNGLQTEVRINDRGPFVANRIIDLSYSAAESLQIIGPGTAPVRIEVIAGPNPAAGFFGVQVGAFRMQDNAERLRGRLSDRYSPISIIPYDSPAGQLYRVRVGRLTSEDAARQLAGELHTTDELTTFVVRLDN